MIRVRLADRDDQARLVEFVRDHWSATHIFAQRPEVFAWQHVQGDGRLNMVLAEDTEAEGRPVLGVLGFIPMGRFDRALGDRDVMLAIWKVSDEGVPPGLGLRLLKFVQAELAPRLIAAIGTSQMVRPIYQVLGYEVGALQHSALFHPNRSDELRIAAGAPAAAFESAPTDDSAAVELLPVDESVSDEVREAVDRLAADRAPAKSWAYIDERFLRHPWYRYDVRAVQREGETVAVVVWRSVEAAGSRALRIVDIIGDPIWLRHGRRALQREIVDRDAEYIDLVQWGVDEQILLDGGFVSTADTPGLVLPNYFSPFEARNVTIELAYKVLDRSEPPVQLYRADSDQDRPNLVTDVDSND